MYVGALVFNILQRHKIVKVIAKSLKVFNKNLIFLNKECKLKEKIQFLIL